MGGPTTNEATAALRLDLGAGKNKREGFVGVDCRLFEGVDIVLDLTERDEFGNFKRWPWLDESVDEVHSSHFIEHLEPAERIHFVNELHRILKPGARATLIAPHWSSCRAYGDLTHKWPPVSEFWLPYLNRAWREQNAPHNDGYTCNFEPTHGFSVREDHLVRNQEYVTFALANWKDAAQDMIATLTKMI
jgi:hypothetical protein